MKTTTTIRSLGWLIGLVLLFSWNLQAESNPSRHSVQFTESFNVSTPAIDPAPINLTATVGVPFSAQLLRTLPVPTGSSTYNLSVTGLPANGLSLTGSDPGFIVGTPLTSGVVNLTVIETFTASQAVNNATTWRAYTITVNPPRPPISLTATIGVPFSALLPRTLPIPLGSSTYFLSVTGLPANGLSLTGSDPGFIVGTPLTSGVVNLTVIETFTTSQAVNNATTWRAYTITVSGGALTLLAPTYNCATGAFRFNTSGGNGSPITFFAIGITGPTTNPDQFVDTGLRTAADAKPLQLQATQSGVTVTYIWDIRAQCPVPVGPIPPPGGALTLLAPTYNCATGAFRFNTGGGDGSPITFFAIGITGPTTTPDQFVDTGLRTANDIEPLQLQATQNGVRVTYPWDLKAACGRARLSTAEPERQLSVVVLGNPVMGETVQLEVSGAQGQLLRVAMVDQQGRLVSEERIVQAAAIERLSVKTGRSVGVYHLQVSIPGQTKVVRVLKTE